GDRSGRADVGRAASRQADLTRMRCERVACKRVEVAEAGTGALRAHVRHAAITHLTAARTAGSRGGTESGRAVAHPGRDGGRRREETAKVSQQLVRTRAVARGHDVRAEGRYRDNGHLTARHGRNRGGAGRRGWGGGGRRDWEGLSGGERGDVEDRRAGVAVT